MIIKKKSYSENLQDALKNNEKKQYGHAAKDYLLCADHSELSVQEQAHHFLHAAQCFERDEQIKKSASYYLKAAHCYDESHYLQHSFSALKAYARCTNDKKNIQDLLTKLQEKGLQDAEIIEFLPNKEAIYQRLIQSEKFSQSFFSSLKTFETFQHLMKWMSIINITQGQQITQIHQPADSIYFIVQGQVEVCTDQQCIGYVEAMSFFGEIEFFLKQTRKEWSIQVTATEDCKMIQIPYKHIIQIKHYLPQIKPIMAKSYCHRIILHRLAVSPIFSELKPEIRKKLSQHVSVIQLLKQEHLFQEGDDATHAYIVISGKIALYLNIQDYDVAFKEINDNELLGEIAIINQNKRSATASALEESYLLCIPSEIFRQLNQQYPELHDQLHTRRTLQLKEVQDFIRDNLPSLMTEIQLESQ
ncbi:MAG: cyclic nucleotide-binding domain-containing protein, partial [Mariprofundaceae bacterium]|nr:cyclic nucleotide-binding domain-containing protein [Mariprofundaceae bacterium]